MTLALRRAAPDDYDVAQADKIVGRVYRMPRALALDDTRIAGADGWPESGRCGETGPWDAPPYRPSAAAFSASVRTRK